MNDEKALVSRVIAGDMQAFRSLIKMNERLVSHMIRRIVRSDADVEELSQDVFLKVYEKIGEFSFQSRLSTWVATIAYRHAINHARKRKLQYADIPDEESFTTRFINEEHPQMLLEDEDLDKYVMKLVDELPEQYRTVLTLYHVSSMSYEEICQIMNMPEGTVKNYLFRARTLLKEKVKKHLGRELQ